MNAESPTIALVERAPGWWECPIRVEGIYGFAYWEEYQKRDHSPIGRSLTEARVNMVRRYCSTVVDIGIGGGAFMIAASEADLSPKGSDINTFALSWLGRRNELWTGDDVEAMTFWDSIEHIENPTQLLSRTQWAFISTPIYDNEVAVRASKHFKPGEHIHYWSHAGLIMYMLAQGFGLADYNTMESDLGREGIGSYAFKKSQ